MAYYYVKSGGTATGDAGRYASQQTGSFATLGTSNYYNSLEDATSNATTAPTHGDFICISNSSSLSTSTAYNYNNGPTGAGTGATFVTVDDANCDVAAVASAHQEWITGGVSDVEPLSSSDGIANYYGVYLKGDDDITFGGNGSVLGFVKCTFEVTGTSDAIAFGKFSFYGPDIFLVDCHVIGPSGANMVMQQGARVRWVGGSVSGGKVNLIDGVGSIAGVDAKFIGLDLSSLTGALVADSGTASTDGSFVVDISRCRLNSGVEYMSSSHTLQFGQRVSVYNSAHDSSAEYQYYVQEESCVAQDDTSFYRTNSVGYPSGTKVSIKVTTSANVSVMRPFWFDLPTVYSDLTSTSTDLLRYYILCADTLTDKDIWLVAVYPDGTNVYISNFEVSSTLTNIADAFDPFRTGTTLTTNTEGWNGYTSQNRYQIDVDTSGDPGAKCVPIIRCYVAKASVSANPIYICVTPDLV